MCLAWNMCLRHRESVVEAGLFCLDKTDVSAAVICPVSTADIYPVSTEDATAAGLRPAAVMASVETG